MEKVTGIGGLFFRARDPKQLSQWYEQCLGVAMAPESYDVQPWKQEAGPTVFAPFPTDTDYFGRPAQSWMVNFRVRNLDAMIAQLRAAGVQVEVDGSVYPNGRFARLTDPEGNAIQLWQPMCSTRPRQRRWAAGVINRCGGLMDARNVGRVPMGLFSRSRRRSQQE